jgi:hypothetical protein
VSHGAGSVNGPHRQQHDTGDANDYYTGGANDYDTGGANDYDTGTHADSGSHARDSASGGSRGGSDVVGRPD